MRVGTEVIVYALIGFAFCPLVGFMTRAQGISALWWTPVGFVFGLYSTSQMLLPLMIGIPRAIRLVSKQQMRPGVFTRILITPLLWFIGLLSVGYFWPWIADFVDTNTAVRLGMWLGTVAIVLTPLSAKGRSDFRVDFDKAYQKFYR